MSSQSLTAPSKLPFWRTVGACYMTVARDFWQLVRISWLWLAIMLPMYAAVHWLTWSWATEAAQREGGAPALLMALLANVIELPALASIAVGWHRLVLQQERVAGAFYLRLDRVVWTYAFVLLAFLVLTLGPWVHAGSWGAGAPYSWAALLASLIALALGVTISLFVLPRLSLILPAIALGERMSLAQAWRATRGNAWRLAMAGLLCSLPPIVPFALLAWHLDESTRASSVLVQTINSLAYVLIVTVAVTLLSLAYRHFVRKQDVGAPPPA